MKSVCLRCFLGLTVLLTGSLAHSAVTPKDEVRDGGQGAFGAYCTSDADCQDGYTCNDYDFGGGRTGKECS